MAGNFSEEKCLYGKRESARGNSSGVDEVERFSRSHRKSRVGLKPVDCLLESIRQGRSCTPAQFRKRALGVKATARLAVGLRRIPAYRAFVPNQGADLCAQVANTDFFAGTKIHQFG